ncbi:hypothetical protein JTB14_033237 [Gonioctena quinquepunctata]|nr:hypothetical protein JTB14_033237 [Gonioctena quinquepunctata]
MDVRNDSNQVTTSSTIFKSKLFDYVRSVGDIVGPKNICFASRISNNRICVYLKNVEFVDELIQNHPSIRVGETDLPVRKLVTPAKRLIISNVSPSIPNDLLETSLKNYGLQLASTITFLKAGIPGDEFNHILSFRRQVYMIPPSENFEMQTSLSITFDRNSLTRICKEKGHLAANCPNTNIANELPSDNTQTGNIGNDPPVATYIQTE